MRLESAIRHAETGCYDYDAGKLISFEPMVKQIVRDILHNTDPGVIAARFHNTVIATIIETVESIAMKQDCLSLHCREAVFRTGI
jgi:hydrogenase maturation factor HypF (carbamoyltransferase family)